MINKNTADLASASMQCKERDCAFFIEFLNIITLIHALVCKPIENIFLLGRGDRTRDDEGNTQSRVSTFYAVFFKVLCTMGK